MPSKFMTPKERAEQAGISRAQLIVPQFVTLFGMLLSASVSVINRWVAPVPETLATALYIIAITIMLTGIVVQSINLRKFRVARKKQKENGKP